MKISIIGVEMRVTMKYWWSTILVDRGREEILMDDLSEPTNTKILNSEFRKVLE